jgi:uncharacterized membrane protein YhaH (DUF805 family)
MPLVEYWKLVVLQRYAKFDGRASRAEYWWFFLANLIIAIGIYILVAIASIFYILLIGFWLALIVPSIAVAVRRLHDTNKSGWMILIGLIPFVGGIILLIFLATQGNLTSNDYGEPEPALALAA